MSFVPNVGFIISMIPPAILGLVVGGLPTALLVVVAYSVINVAVDYLVQPRFIGGAVDLSPVVVTVSLLFWALVLGGAGAIFAVPLTIMVAGIADSFDSTRPLSRMLAERVPALTPLSAADRPGDPVPEKPEPAD
jgi:predicted PurR-regulated permease PerM